MSVFTPIEMHRHSDVLLQFGPLGEDITSLDMALVLLASRDGAIIFTKTLGSGVTITDGPGGRCEVRLDADDIDMSLGSYYFMLYDAHTGSRGAFSEGTCTIRGPRIP